MLEIELLHRTLGSVTCIMRVEVGLYFIFIMHIPVFFSLLQHSLILDDLSYTCVHTWRDCICEIRYIGTVMY